VLVLSFSGTGFLLPRHPDPAHSTSISTPTSGDWSIASAKLGKWELDNLAEDRTEFNDLARKHPERLKAMVAQWHDIPRNKEPLADKKGKPVKEGLTPQKFGARKDPSQR
jgi:hypothetical protein